MYRRWNGGRLFTCLNIWLEGTDGNHTDQFQNQKHDDAEEQQ